MQKARGHWQETKPFCTKSTRSSVDLTYSKYVQSEAQHWTVTDFIALKPRNLLLLVSRWPFVKRGSILFRWEAGSSIKTKMSLCVCFEYPASWWKPEITVTLLRLCVCENVYFFMNQFKTSKNKINEKLKLGLFPSSCLWVYLNLISIYSGEILSSSKNKQIT